MSLFPALWNSLLVVTLRASLVRSDNPRCLQKTHPSTSHMMHPHLGKHDLSKKKFYRVIYVVMVLTFIAATAVLWMFESGVL